MTDMLDAPATVLGEPVKRTEDPRFITGTGNYIDDIKLPSLTQIAILRSPYSTRSMSGILVRFGAAISLPSRSYVHAW